MLVCLCVCRLQAICGAPPALPGHMTPFHTLAEVLPAMYLEMLQGQHRQDYLFKRFSVAQTPIDPDLYKGSPPATVAGGSRKRGRGGQSTQAYSADHAQAELNCAPQAIAILEQALFQIFEDDCVIHDMKLLRAGVGRQLFHRDLPPTAPADCATLVWAWDGPRRITFLLINYETSTVTPVVVDLQMGEALLIPASSIHAGGGCEHTNTCLFFYILRKPALVGVRRRLPSGWQDKLTKHQYWPLVAEPEQVQVLLQQDPLHPAVRQQEHGGASAASSSSTTAGAASASSAAGAASSSAPFGAGDSQYAAYHDRLISESNNSPVPCVICMDPLASFPTVELQCSHAFHTHCLQRALTTPWNEEAVHPGAVYTLSGRCPTCRTPLRRGEVRRLDALIGAESGDASLVHLS